MYTEQVDSEMRWLEEQLNSYVFKPRERSTKELDRLKHVIDSYGLAVKESFIRQYVERKETETALRVSSLGKPAVLQALTVLGLEKATEPTTKLRHIFHTGDVFEAYLIAYMQLCGYDVEQEQCEVNFNGVLGHIDLVASTPSGKVVLEVKTMSQNYFYNFLKEPNDERGYLTQAAIYSRCMNLPIYWVCCNKGTHEVKIVKPDVEAFDLVLKRAEKLIPKLRALTSLEDVVSTLTCPPVVPELFRRKETGNYLVPPAMKYSPFRHCWYEIETEYTKAGKPKEYVVDYYPKEEVLERLQRMTGTPAYEEVEELLEDEGA